ncbi:MAG: membrane protein [Planctomycetota bacterium]|nr:MAG: membrane protein [Planctomycetota bacterium]
MSDASGAAQQPEAQPPESQPLDDAAREAAEHAAALRERHGAAFVEKLGGALHRYGAPANRLDDVLVLLSQELGLKASFFSLPSAIFYTYDRPVDGGFARLQRVFGHELDLSKLARLDRLFNRALDGDLPLEHATDEVDRITAAPPPYPTLITWLAFVIVSGSAARFFGGGVAEMYLAAAAGAALGALYLFSATRANLRRLFEPAGALLVSLCTSVLALRFGASSDVATLAGLIVLVPGFSLTIGATELALHHPVSGMTRLAGAGMTLLMLSMGVLFGRQLGELVAGSAPLPVVPIALPGWTEAAALLVSGLGLGVLFRAERRDLPFTVMAVMVPYLGFKLGAQEFGLETRIFLGGLLSGIFANLYARVLDRPALAMRLPGVLILVPGATSFVSLGQIAAGDSAEGIATLFRVGMTIIALVTGLLVANVVLSPRKAL